MGTKHQRHYGEEKPRSPPVLLAASPGIATGAPSAPPVPVSSEGLRGAGAPACRGEVPERDRQEGASPSRRRRVTARRLRDVRCGRELLLLLPVQVPAAVVSRVERGLRAAPMVGKPLSGQQVPLWAGKPLLN